MTGWWRALQRWRHERTLERRAIPDALWHRTVRRLPFLRGRSPQTLARLRELATLFLAQKEFSGAGGLKVTDAMAVSIAAQACLPVLELGLGCYAGFVGIVVHPHAVAAPRVSTDEDGIVHQYTEELAGEAMDGGPLMLAWSEVASAGRSAADGYNVVVHEFVHVLDLHAGRGGKTAMPATWSRQLGLEYERFVARVDQGEETWLDPYGAQAIEEFFAVASEAFFVAPETLVAEEPALYPLLVAFFRQDPASEALDSA